jgi:hypothetical protein
LAFDSNIVGTFKLEGELLSALRRYGFGFGPGFDTVRERTVYLYGNSDQRGREIFESDCWSWDITETNPQITVYFRLSISEEKGGVVCTPILGGNWRGGAYHVPTINNFLRVVAGHFSNVHPLIKEAVNTNFQMVVSWNDINVTGIKSLRQLFHDAFGQNEKICDLARSNLSPFNPDPFQYRATMEIEDRLFIPELIQSRLLEQWKKQLESFKNSLA